MLKIENFSKLYENINYLHESTEEIYEHTFSNVLEEHLIFHDKKTTKKYIEKLYKYVMFIPTPDETLKVFRGTLDFYTLDKLEQIFKTYSYRLAKIVDDYIIFRPENDYLQKYTNWYFHLSPNINLCKTGIKTKSSSLDGFEKYDKRIYLYPFFTLINDDSENIYEAIKEKAKEIADQFRYIRKQYNTYYIYSVHLPAKFPIYKDHAQSRNYAVYVKNDISNKNVEIIGEV